MQGYFKNNFLQQLTKIESQLSKKRRPYKKINIFLNISLNYTFLSKSFILLGPEEFLNFRDFD